MAVRKTSVLVEAGICATLAVLLAFLGATVPVVGMIGRLLWPLPIVVCGCRHGLKWSSLCALAAALIITIYMGPLVALMLISVPGSVGLLIGEGMRRRLAPVKIVTAGSFLATGVFLVMFLFLLKVQGINWLTFMQNTMAESMSITKEFYGQLGYTPSQLQELEQLSAHIKTMLSITFPLILFSAGSVTVLANYYFARKILSKLGEEYPWFPPFVDWRLPKQVLLCYGASILIVLFVSTTPEKLLYRLGLNMFLFSSILLMLQALAVVRWATQVGKLPKLAFPIFAVLTFLIPMVSQVAVFVGAYDLVFDFRRRLQP